VALIALVKGINVGGHRAFRPSTLAKALARFGAINIGAAGTFVIRGDIGRRQLRVEIQKHLPFISEIIICAGRDMLRLASQEPFAGQPSGRAVVRFVSVVARRCRPTTRPPLTLPPTGRWYVRCLAYQHPFLVGVHRREMRAISYLGQLERVVGVPMTTRGWNTIQAIARILRQ
jgi:uncharacterized protein (DUF1697 family)